ncbi:dynein heavy chain 5, axonemal isoform X1, partial [Lates japonicus]
MSFSSRLAKVSYRNRPTQPSVQVESLKEMQQKLKEEREAKRAQLDGRHDYILSIVASCLGLEKADVEDAILEGNQIDRMEQFFVVEGLPHLMFYYQDTEPVEA